MRRKKGTLLPLETSILQCGIDLAVRGAPFFHGFMIAKEIRDREDAKLLTAHGTLYKALDRLQTSGLLESDWEDPLVAAQEGRPRRRFYHVTAAGEAALVRSLDAVPAQASQRQIPGMAAL
ncbi:MAG: PadR family transcriptional regulator [Dehalococcoidia bacterium]